MTKIIYLLLLTFLFSCKEELYIPKPPTYLKLELPEHNYSIYSDDCPYELSVSDLFKVESVSNGQQKTCHKDINLGSLNGTIHLTYIHMIEPLGTYVNFVNDKIDEHKIKATAINDMKIIIPENKVFCTFFELEGNVASPFQFYMTDSINNFASAVVYFNSTPNYDSLKPSLEYLKIDLEHMINNFQWKN
tara:strand:+ start:2962 stop:3531 length:570 start_codon:yes stop_codon:yes gene_type:complete